MSYSESEAALLAKVEALRRDNAELIKVAKDTHWFLNTQPYMAPEVEGPSKAVLLADLEALVAKHHERTEQS